MGGTVKNASETHNLLVLTYIELFINAGACTLFYLFKSQRKFPCAALGWTTIFNMLFNLYNLAYVDQVGNSYNECKATLFMFAGLGFGLVAVNNVFSCVLFVSLRLNKSMAYADDKRYYWGSVAHIIACCLIVGTIMVAVPFKEQGCTWGKPYLYIPVILGSFCLAFQIIMIGLSMQQVIKIVKKASGETSTKHDRRLFILTIRLLLVFIFQLLGFFPVYLTEIFSTTDLPNAFYIRFAGGISDAIVLTITNRALMKKVLPKVLHIFTSKSGSDSNSEPTSAKRPTSRSVPSSTSGSVQVSISMDPLA